MTPSPRLFDALLRRSPGIGGAISGMIIAMSAGVEVARWEVSFPPVRDPLPRSQ